MSNGEMLKVLKEYNEKGTPIDDAIYKSLALTSHIEIHEKLTELCDTGCPQAERNKDEIDRLRGRNNLTDLITGVGLILASWFGIKQP